MSGRRERTAPVVTRLPLHAAMQDARPALTHLRLLCDDTAMLQHAHHGVARIEDGYCVDDAARMLPIADELSNGPGGEEWAVVLGRLLAFLRGAAIDSDGAMRNFMAWDRHWLDEPHGGDHVGRTIWGLGEVVEAGGAHSELCAEAAAPAASSVDPQWPTRSIVYAGSGWWRPRRPTRHGMLTSIRSCTR